MATAAKDTFLGALCEPTRELADKLHMGAHIHFNIHLSRRVLHVVIGLVLMAVGSTIAHFAGHTEPTAMAIAGDTFGYGLHGLGAAPIVKLLCDLLEIEV